MQQGMRPLFGRAGHPACFGYRRGGDFDTGRCRSAYLLALAIKEIRQRNVSALLLDDAD